MFQSEIPKWQITKTFAEELKNTALQLVVYKVIETDPKTTLLLDVSSFNIPTCKNVQLFKSSFCKKLLWKCIYKTTALAKFNLLCDSEKILECDKVKSFGSEGYKSRRSFDSREIQVRKINWIVLICFYTRESSRICSIFQREEIEFDISVIYFSLNNWLF